MQTCKVSVKHNRSLSRSSKETMNLSTLKLLNHSMTNHSNNNLNLTTCSKNHAVKPKLMLKKNHAIKIAYASNPSSPVNHKRSQSVRKIIPLEIQIDKDIDNLIQKQNSTSLKYMNYIKWKKRRENNLPDLTLEKNYAKMISNKQNTIKRRHNLSQNSLKNLKQSMEDIIMLNKLTGEFMAKEVSKALLTKNYKHVSWFGETIKQGFDEDHAYNSIHRNLNNARKEKCIETVIIDNCKRLDQLKLKRN